MNDAIKNNLPRLVAEGFVIVISVLLALSADAWWAGIQDRSRVDDHLRALDATSIKWRSETPPPRRWRTVV